jgi:hypothetical protein
MKKSTKKLLMSLSIILIFGLSSIAFVATGIFGANPEQNQPKQVKPVFEGEVDQQTENAYIQKGFTWLKYYYTGFDLELSTYIDSLPQIFQTPNGQTQMIVQKLDKAYLNETNYIIVESLAGSDEFPASINNITDTLCRLLTITPAECMIRGIQQITQNQTVQNLTAS